MGLIKIMVLIMSIVLNGCVSADGIPASITYKEGYQNGIKKNLGQMAEQMNNNGFPYLNGVHWSEPLIQETRIPAHIQGGVFYPEHNELVIITPGEWRKAGAFPLISSARADMEKVEVLSADITGLPRGIGNERQIK